jgi:hypothetical protein
MTEFESNVCGIPCIIRVTDWEGYVPARLSGLVEPRRVLMDQLHQRHFARCGR